MQASSRPNFAALGINVGPAELTVAMNALFDAFPNMRLDPGAEEPFVTGSLEQRGVSPLL